MPNATKPKPADPARKRTTNEEPGNAAQDERAPVRKGPDRTANANPQPGKDERRNRSI